MSFKEKYVMYKKKYLKLRNISQLGGNNNILKIKDRYYVIDEYKKNKVYLVYKKMEMI